MGVEVSDFGITKKGERVHQYYLYNDFMEIYLTDLGAAIINIWTRDKLGRFRDIVLGYDDVSGYELNTQSLGVIVGRNCNRIGGASFCIDDKMYKLDANDGTNSLHSGPDQYKYRVWEAWTDCENDEPSVTFMLNSPDGDQHFPGNAKISVTYTLTIDNSLKIDYKAKADQDTIINLTNHAYFNLNGTDGGSILGHKVRIDSDEFLELGETSVPTGKILPVEGTPMDFRNESVIRDQMDMNYAPLAMAKGYDHCYILKNNGELKLCAGAYAPESGICLDVYTDRPSLQFYTANYLIDDKGKNGRIYQPREALCFETQGWTDAPNHADFPSTVVRKGEIFRSTTIYAFGRK